MKKKKVLLILSDRKFGEATQKRCRFQVALRKFPSILSSVQQRRFQSGLRLFYTSRIPQNKALSDIYVINNTQLFQPTIAENRLISNVKNSLSPVFISPIHNTIQKTIIRPLAFPKIIIQPIISHQQLTAVIKTPNKESIKNDQTPIPADKNSDASTQKTASITNSITTVIRDLNSTIFRCKKLIERSITKNVAMVINRSTEVNHLQSTNVQDKEPHIGQRPLSYGELIRRNSVSSINIDFEKNTSDRQIMPEQTVHLKLALRPGERMTVLTDVQKSRWSPRGNLITNDIHLVTSLSKKERNLEIFVKSKRQLTEQQDATFERNNYIRNSSLYIESDITLRTVTQEQKEIREIKTSVPNYNENSQPAHYQKPNVVQGIATTFGDQKAGQKNIDIAALTDNVYRMLESKIRIERERRGRLR